LRARWWTTWSPPGGRRPDPSRIAKGRLPKFQFRAAAPRCFHRVQPGTAIAVPRHGDAAMKRDDIQVPGIQLTEPPARGQETILTREALAFVADLHRKFEKTRRELMQARARRQAKLDAGETYDFL